MPFIRLDQVDLVYHAEEIETRALADISLSIESGEFVAISGPSGSGKTSLMHVLGLLDLPNCGSYHLDGHDTSTLSAGQRAQLRNAAIGFVFQAFNLLEELRVEDNVELPLIYRKLPRAERKRRVAAALEQVGLIPRARHFPVQLSGGQQQRVAIARALAGEPRLLLADEPTGNLDSSTGEQIYKLLESLNQRGTTICMVTHDAGLAARARRQIHIRDGRIVDESRAP